MQERSNNSQQCLGVVFLSLIIIIIVCMCVFVHVAVLCCIQVHVNLNVGTLFCHPGHFQYSSIPLSPGTRLLVLSLFPSSPITCSSCGRLNTIPSGWVEQAHFLFMFLHLYKRFVPWTLSHELHSSCCEMPLNTTLISASSWNPSSLGILILLPGGNSTFQSASAASWMCRCGHHDRQNEECWAERMQLDDTAVAPWFTKAETNCSRYFWAFVQHVWKAGVNFAQRHWLHSGVLCPDDTQTEKQPQVWNLSLGCKLCLYPDRDVTAT